MQSQRPQYAIIGGGIGGLSLAIAMHKRGLSVMIYEQSRKFGEIGAGVAFTANAVQAMHICGEGIYEVYKGVASENAWDSKKDVWFDFMDGMDQDISGHQDSLFTIHSPVGTNGVHRAHFLDGMVHLAPKEIARFGKHLDTLAELPSGRIRMNFHDGTTAEADAVIGCDGIKSRVRHQLLNGGPGSDKVYTYKYAYRGLIDMPDAIEAIGEERAVNSCMWMCQDRHLLTLPIDHGKTLNLVAFTTTPHDWPDYSKSTLPAHIEDALEDFSEAGPNVKKLLRLCKPDLDRWSIFDLGEHPLVNFNKGRICVLGDAAHATTPHHGAGAGMCIEDAAVLATILADPAVNGDPGTIEAAFAVYSQVRKPRGQWLVQHSRRQGDLVEWRIPEVGRDFDKISHEIQANNFYIEHMDVQKLCDEARALTQRAIRTGKS